MTSSTALPFAGRTVVVTGAARGMGHALALLLEEQGADVVGLDLPEHDVANDGHWAALAASLGRRPVHGLVNNAGVTLRSRVGEVTRADWDRVLAVNLTGAMPGIQALAPLMPPGASIVNVGSTAALTGHYPVAYTASKWGLRGLTHAAATELGPRGIRVNIVHPGFIETEMTASAPVAMLEAHLGSTPLERPGRAAEVAAVIEFLLSEAAAYVTGAEVPVDGGSRRRAGRSRSPTASPERGPDVRERRPSGLTGPPRRANPIRASRG